MSKPSVEEDGNHKYSAIESENDVSQSKVTQDGISLISKVKPLKFCLLSTVFHGISLISKVLRENREFLFLLFTVQIHNTSARNRF
jgi:hypothetical protein